MAARVTDILSILRPDLMWSSGGTLAYKTWLGREVHRYGLAALAGVSLPSGDDAVDGYVDRILEWQELTKFEVSDTEVEIKIPNLNVRGRLDLIGRFPGDKYPSILDLKRVASVSWVTGLQLAAYQKGYRRKTQRRIALWIPEAGAIKAKDDWPDSDWNDFMAAYLIYFNRRWRWA